MMPRRATQALFLVCCLLQFLWAGETATGVVYHDINGNGRRDSGEKGIAGVPVSNQREVVLTDKKGRYELPVGDETVIFVTKPSGYAVPLDKRNLPRFYYVHQPAGGPELTYPTSEPTGPLPASVDFPLRKVKEPTRFTALILGDTQPATHAELSYLRDDIVAELVGSDAAFAMVLGDVLYDDLSLYPRYNAIMSRIGVPVYNVPGNHDMNYDVPDDEDALETFRRYYGPSYYSFDYGKVHVVVLDDVEYLGRNDAGRPRYRGFIGENQLAWLRNDLAQVPDDRLVVLTMHIAIYSGSDAGDAVRIVDADALYSVLESHPNILALAGHHHVIEHRYLGPNEGWNGASPIHQLIAGAACGAWWSGPKDERGIPLAYQTDGAPNGYYVFTFDGSSYTARYQVAAKDLTEQMRIMLPGDANIASSTDILVNIYDGGPKSTVSYSIDDQPFTSMAPIRRKDPFMEELYARYPKDKRGWISATESTHLWTALMPVGLTPGVHTIAIQATDRYGQSFISGRVFEVE